MKEFQWTLPHEIDFANKILLIDEFCLQKQIQGQKFYETQEKENLKRLNTLK